MSQHSASDANTGRKRGICNDVALQRSAKNRNIVDSSPTSGPSQPEIVEDSEDEVNELINTQLGDIHVAPADDPQVDSRTQDPTQLPVEDDDLLSDPDEITDVDSEPRIPHAIISEQVASQSRPPLSLGEIKIHQR